MKWRVCLIVKLPPEASRKQLTSCCSTPSNRSRIAKEFSRIWDFALLCSFIRLEVTIKNIIVVLSSLSRFFPPTLYCLLTAGAWEGVTWFWRGKEILKPHLNANMPFLYLGLFGLQSATILKNIWFVRQKYSKHLFFRKFFLRTHDHLSKGQLRRGKTSHFRLFDETVPRAPIILPSQFWSSEANLTT